MSDRTVFCKSGIGPRRPRGVMAESVDVQLPADCPTKGLCECRFPNTGSILLFEAGGSSRCGGRSPSFSDLRGLLPWTSTTVALSTFVFAGFGLGPSARLAASKCHRPAVRAIVEALVQPSASHTVTAAARKSLTNGQVLLPFAASDVHLCCQHDLRAFAWATFTAKGFFGLGGVSESTSLTFMPPSLASTLQQPAIRRVATWLTRTACVRGSQRWLSLGHSAGGFWFNESPIGRPDVPVAAFDCFGVTACFLFQEWLAARDRRVSVGQASRQAKPVTRLHRHSLSLRSPAKLALPPWLKGERFGEPFNPRREYEKESRSSDKQPKQQRPRLPYWSRSDSGERLPEQDPRRRRVSVGGHQPPLPRQEQAVGELVKLRSQAHRRARQNRRRGASLDEGELRTRLMRLSSLNTAQGWEEFPALSLVPATNFPTFVSRLPH